MLENEALRGDTVIDTLVNMSSDEMREDTVVKTLANIADGDVPDDVIGALLAAFGAPESLRGETVVETVENIVREAGVTDDVPDDFIGALLMLGDVSGDTTGVNLFAVSGARNGFINTNGAFTSSVNDNHPFISDYIAVKPGQSLVFQAWALEDATASGNTRKLWMAYDFYDSSKAALSNRTDKYGGTTQSSGYAYNIYTVTVPEGASYVRVCSRRVFGGYAKLEIGSEPTPWTPCPQDVAVVINEASVCSASDDFSMPPLAVTVFGKSVQGGTPTPSDPVDIESVSTLTAHASGDGVLVWNQLANVSTSTTHPLPSGSTVAVEHKYYAAVTITITSASSKYPFFGFYTRVDGSDKSIMRLTSPKKEVGTWTAANVYTSSYDAVSNGHSSSEGSLWWYFAKQNATCSFDNVMLIDLTRMFGAGNEPTAAEFEEMYPETYYAYDAGTAHDSDGWPITINLDGHELRSLPDGTRDLLTVDINGNVSLVQQVERYEISTTDGEWDVNTSGNFIHPIGSMPTYVGWATSKLCNVAASSDVSTSKNYMTVKSNGLTLEQFIEAADGTPIVITLALATPVVHSLSSVALPALPAPKFDVWTDTDVPTTLTMRYLQA